MRVLALESSTTSAKALLYDSDTAAISTMSRRFHLISGDSAQRDPDEVGSQLFALGRECLAGRDVDLVALSSTWHGLTLQRPDGTSATPVYEWPYPGAEAITTRLRRDPAFVRWYYEHTGAMVSAIFPAFKLRMLADAGVDLTSGLVMDQGSVLFQRLTGVAATTYSLASGTGLLNVDTGEWSGEVAEALGVGQACLPDLLPSRTLRPLTTAAGAVLGLRPGTPVLAPGPDGGLTQIGDRASEPGVMTFSMGTSGAMRLATDTPVLSPRQSTWCYRSPDTWLSGIATSGCGNCVDWARVTMFGPDTDFVALEPRLRAGVRDVPIFLPFLFGERCPGWLDQRRGGFVGLQPTHDTVDLYQAVLQGVVFNLFQCYEELVRLNGQPHRIRLSGGVLFSPFWTQLTADVIGAELEVSTQQHASAMGAIRLGLSTLGADDAPAESSGDPQRTLTPNPTMSSYYRDRYEAYLKAYEQSTNKEMSPA
ncbi:MAG: FGGY-family carbohydrate kinase [Micrococcales bacterium]|nr:FGGY-family carbohydrate kinase [Micrococcales bacterium]